MGISFLNDGYWFIILIMVEIPQVSSSSVSPWSLDKNSCRWLADTYRVSKRHCANTKDSRSTSYSSADRSDDNEVQDFHANRRVFPKLLG